MSKSKISLTDAIEKLKLQKDQVSTLMMKRGMMSVEYFAPHLSDTQSPHSQDELYIIVRGHGDFYRDGKILDCKAGDLLFVPAGMSHHFENFSDDFATWVIFYGPDGGSGKE